MTRRYLVVFCIGILGGVITLQPTSIHAAATSSAREQVVLLHGLGRREGGMKKLEKRLNEAGYEVQNIGYPSRREEAEVLIQMVAEQIDVCCADNGRTVHFVAHSLGGIIARAYLDQRRPDNLGKVVLIATPNQGSELVDRFGDMWLFEALTGPAALELGTASGSLPNRIGPPYYPLGIIASTSDGVVAADSTKLFGMTDYLEFRGPHGRMRAKPEVVDEVIHFLEHGRFSGNSLSDD